MCSVLGVEGAAVGQSCMSHCPPNKHTCILRGSIWLLYKVGDSHSLHFTHDWEACKTLTPICTIPLRSCRLLIEATMCGNSHTGATLSSVTVGACMGPWVRAQFTSRTRPRCRNGRRCAFPRQRPPVGLWRERDAPPSLAGIGRIDICV